MKKHKDILESQKRFVQRREDFLELNYKFYDNLVRQIGEELEIPNGSLIKYKAGTNDNINIIEKWMELNDDESCSMRVGIVADNISHTVSLSNYKNGNDFTLSVICEDEHKEFEYNLKTVQPDSIDFKDVTTFISDSLVGSYDKWKF
ncbi:hypothetical protein [uncultured Dokdonia sp.]|uniref:hypothetical protein n=1 Tax=uncultured Dokdonia sp. TaxID=575653 RepID=UPI00260F93D2|nr:hypothetical protein [uncultured Dokdonia sp.]